MRLHSPSQIEESISTTLLQKVQHQDEEAWSLLVTIYGPLVYAWCRRWGVSPDAAADIVQDVFRAVSQAVGRFDKHRPGGTFRGWLWTISQNAANRHFTLRQRNPQGRGGTDQHQLFQNIPAPAPDEESDVSDSVLVLQAALKAIEHDFEPRTWNMFWRVTIDGEPTNEVARANGLSAKAVRQAKHRVLKRLREQYHADFDI